MTKLLGEPFTRLSTRVVFGLFEGRLVTNLLEELFTRLSTRAVFAAYF